MKQSALLKFLFVGIILFLRTNPSFGQEEPVFATFRVQETEKKVLLTMVFEAGSTCEGIQVFRSEDGVNFKAIGEIPGICGDPEASSSFSFLDEKPLKNLRSYYQVLYGKKNKSEVKTIYLIEPGENGYLLRWVPQTQSTEILFKNPQNETHEITIYDMGGLELLQSANNESSFNLKSNALPRGIYVFVIRNKKLGKNIVGKLIVK